MVHLAIICYCVERYTSGFPKSLRRMLQGLYGLCLFHPFQAQNFTWAFQLSFIIPFAIGNAALLAVAHFERLPYRWRNLTVLGVGIAPLLAAMGLASGLMFGPAITALAYTKRLPRKLLFTLGTLSTLDVVAYARGYHTPANHPSPLQPLLYAPLDIIRYVLTLLNASWQFFCIGLVSIACLAACTAAAMRHRERVSDLEWFCFAECGLVLTTGVLVACGRIQYGIAQAAEGRYQTLAVLYWASLFSLVLIAIWRWHPDSFRLAQLGIVLLTLTPVLSLPGLWRHYAALADQNNAACSSVVGGRHLVSDIKQLDFFADDAAVEIRAACRLLRRQWSR